MERKFKPSDVKKLSNICNDIKKSLSFDNPIIENRKLSRDNTRFKKLMEYAVPSDELRKNTSEDDNTCANINNIIFLKENDAKEALDILYNESPQDAIEYLKQWHTNEVKTINEHIVGTSDEIFEDGSYIMYFNKNLGYIGLNHKS